MVRFVYCLSHSLCSPVPVVVIQLDPQSLVSLRLLELKNNFSTLSLKNHWDRKPIHVPHMPSPHLRREYMSNKLFCIGVPVTAHLAPALSLHTAMEVWTFGFLILWASSNMTRAQSTLSRGEQGDDPLCKKKQTIYNPEQLPRQALWRATCKYFFQKEAFSFHWSAVIWALTVTEEILPKNPLSKASKPKNIFASSWCQFLVFCHFSFF